MKFYKIIFTIAMILVFSYTTVFATNGYFKIGYGTKNKAMSGIGAAIPLSPIIAAVNPAGMFFVGKSCISISITI